MAGIVCQQMPRSLIPDALRGLSVGFVLLLVGNVIGITAIAIGAWAAVAVTQGDGTHGAHLFAAAMPIAPTRRALSKLVALAAAALAPPIAFAAILSAAVLTGDLGSGRDLFNWTLTVVVASLVGAALALAIAPIVRGSFSAVALALLLGLAALIAGCVGAALTMPWLGRAYIEALTFAGTDLAWSRMTERARWIGALAGLATTAVVCGLIGISALRAPRSRRASFVGVVIALAAAIVVGAIAASRAIATDPVVKSSSVLMRFKAHKASASEIVAAIEGRH